MGPAVVKHILALGMPFEIKRHRRQKTARVILDHDVLRQPSGLRGDRAGDFQRMQEVIGQKRIVAAGASVPGVAGYLVQTLDQFNARAAAAIGHGDPLQSSLTQSGAPPPFGKPEAA